MKQFFIITVFSLFFLSSCIFLPKLKSTSEVPEGFVLIKAGSFQMGSDKGDESPIHRVTISQDFYISDHEVTLGEYRQFNPKAKSKDCENDDCPVIKVSWHNVQAYIRWLNNKKGRIVFRLPTEAEWEYAARSGTSTKYFCGESKFCLDNYAWYSTSQRILIRTKHVKTKKPNTWGLYDMYGNVWEWVSDWYGKYLSGPTIDPQGSSFGSGRVMRGGSWFDSKYDLIATNRSFAEPNYRTSLIGFRLVWNQLVPKADQETEQRCELVTKKLTLKLDTVKPDGSLFQGCKDPSCIIVAPIVAGVVLPVGSFIISGSIVVVGNTVHWIEGQGRCEDSQTNNAIQLLISSTKSVGGRVLNTVEDAIDYLKRLGKSEEN